MGNQYARQALGSVMSRNLRHPKGIAGRTVLNILTKKNRLVEETAVRLSNIQPDQRVLEVGYGHGVGLMQAYHRIKDGHGTIYGIDFSETAYKMTKSQLKHPIAEGKVILQKCGITEMTFPDNFFDLIFHTNCYYFWDQMDPEVTALHRVLKPNGLMLAVLNETSLREVRKKGFMQHGNTDPERYMTSLKRNGFVNVRIDVFKDTNSGAIINVVYATASKSKT